MIIFTRYQVSPPALCDLLLLIALLATSYWLRNRPKEFVFFAGFSIIVFRCELALMFGLMLLATLIYSNVNICRLLLWILATGIVSLGKYATLTATTATLALQVYPVSELSSFLRQLVVCKALLNVRW